MDYKNINDYEVLYMIKEKDDYAQDMMYKKYRPIIKSIAKKYANFAKNKGADYEDLIQEGYIGLSNAISSYRENCNSLFYTYASLCIERQICLFCRSAASKRNEVLSTALFDDEIYNREVSTDFSTNPELSLSYKISKEEFILYKNHFDIPNSCILELRYNGFSYQEIAKLLDMKVSTVDGRLCKIRKTLQRLNKSYI